MAGAYVQEWHDGASGTSFTVTVSGATANNLLVAVVAVNENGTTFSASGWTGLASHDYIADTGSVDGGCAAYYRIASGDSGDNFSPSWTGSGQGAGMVHEFSGLASSSPLEDFAEDTSNLTTNVTSQGTGTATPLTSNGMAVAMLANFRAAYWLDAIAVNNAFANFSYFETNFARGMSGIASKAYTSTAGQNATFSCSDTGAGAWGAMAVFKEPGGAAAYAPPPVNRHARYMQLMHH